MEPEASMERGLRSRVIHGLGWKAFSQIAVQVVALVTTVFIAHLLTPSDVGLVAMATVFSALALILTDLALGAALVQRETLTEEDRSSAFWLSVCFGLALTLAGLALAGPIANLYGQPDVEPLFQVISITFFVAALGTTQNALLIRDMRFRILESRTVVSVVLAGGVAILLAFLGAGPWAIVGQKLTVNITSTALVWRASRWRPRFLVSRASVWHLVNFSGWLVGSRLLAYMNGNADNYLVGRYAGSASLGAYSIAYNVMLVPLTRLVSPVQQVFYPVLSRLRDAQRVGEIWLRSTRVVAFVTIPAFAGMAVVAPDFVHVVLGSQWEQSVEILQILCWVGILQSLSLQTVSVLQALDRTSWLFRFGVVGTTVTVTSFAIGVQWGATGVAAGFAVSTTILSPFYLRMPIRLTGVGAVNFLRAIQGVVEATVVMAGTLWLARIFLVESLPAAARLVVLVAVGACVYLPLVAWRSPALAAELRNLRRSPIAKDAAPIDVAVRHWRQNGPAAAATRFVVPTALGPVQPGPAPSFSVVIAAYQAAGTLAEAVESALAQTAPPHEVIVVDDGSTDGTAAVLEPFSSRITVIRQENRGKAAAANAGARAATGDFLAILDADDAFEPERLEALGALASARPDLDLLMSDAILEVEGRTVATFCEGTPFAREQQDVAIFDRCYLVAPAVRRERLLQHGGFDETIRTGEDWDCWIRLLLGGSLAGLVPVPLYRYRMTPGSLTDDRVASMRDRVAVLEKAAGYIEADPRTDALERALERTRRRVALIEAEAALRSAAGDFRKRALCVVFGRGFGLRTRLKALAAAVAPRAARRRLEAREAAGRTRLRRSYRQ